ncbi:Phosphatidate cytidylyltransferase mitochondrial [Fasciola gigantica]|uniref:Phosphatidate cytidylyltransferase, mitochondrial n=1 Tax=Fasciola gigantica TaxID=46835 RepID=A0A504Z849_FASGI|nr:Phosphatidate cytidylyltransferase mitochondrial [Fasciola gigantica]
MSSLSLSLLRRIICNLSPQPNSIAGAFAYGSVVFPQHGRPSGNGQIDLVLLVTDPIQWHLLNIRRHPEHYNMLMRSANHQNSMPFYLRTILTSCPGPKVYYNPLVKWHDEETKTTLLLKYGVVHVDNVISDLTNWSDLYIAGRLHKPVLWLPTTDGDKDDNGGHHKIWNGKRSFHAPLDEAQRANLLTALSYVLLTSAPTQRALPESDLFYALAAISYHGDWRMIVGEDKDKIARLVTGPERVAKFRELYQSCLSDPSLSKFVSFEPSNKQSDRFVLHIIPPRDDPTFVAALLNNLPTRLRNAIFRNKITAGDQCTGQIPVETIRASVRRVIVRTVRRSSVQQTVLGFLSAGPTRSVVYAAAKLRKMLASLGVIKWS